MEFLLLAGVVTFFIGIIAIPVSLFILLTSAITRNKKLSKTGLYVLLGGSGIMLLSLSLCSMGKFSI
jgi:hypothetical protein